MKYDTQTQPERKIQQRIYDRTTSNEVNKQFGKLIDRDTRKR